MKAHQQGFSEEICKIMRTFSPSDREFFLVDTISFPVEMHIDLLCLFWGEGVGR